MQITVNGEPHQLSTPLSLREALDSLGLTLPTHAALALNERVVPPQRPRQHSAPGGRRAPSSSSPPSADSPEAPLSP